MHKYLLTQDEDKKDQRAITKTIIQGDTNNNVKQELEENRHKGTIIKNSHLDFGTKTRCKPLTF